MTVENPLVSTGIIAHRGASMRWPENTLAAIKAVAQSDVKWVETDVQFTRDNQLVMVHDKKLDRTTTGNDYVALSDLKTIKNLDAGVWMGEEFKGMEVPTLREFIECAVANGLNLQLELKERAGREKHLTDLVCDELERSWPFGSSKLFVSGFSERCLRRMQQRMPEVPRALALSFVPENPDQLAEEVGVSIMQVQDKFVDEQSLELIANSNIEFGVATVNNPERARVLLGGGVQQISTDDPALLDAARNPAIAV